MTQQQIQNQVWLDWIDDSYQQMLLDNPGQ